MSDSGGLPEEHEEHVNHEAWVIPYADLLTLLMAMFIALFAISTVNTSKFKDLALGFNQALGGGKLDNSVFAGSNPKDDSPIPGNGYGTGPGSGGSLVASDNILTASQLSQLLNATDELSSAKAQQAEALSKVQQAIDSQAQAAGFGKDIHTQLQSRGLVVTVVTDKVLFDSGSAALRPAGAAAARARCEGGAGDSQPSADRRVHRLGSDCDRGVPVELGAFERPRGSCGRVLHGDRDRGSARLPDGPRRAGPHRVERNCRRARAGTAGSRSSSSRRS